MTETNYFVCTLGEARQYDRPFRDIDHLLSVQAEGNPYSAAIGFFRNDQADYAALNPVILTFGDVQQGVLVTAELLSETLSKHKVQAGEAIGLLSSSSPGFLFTWLACCRLGHPVLLIAPECSASGIASLCQSCDISTLLTDEKHADLGQRASDDKTIHEVWELRCISQPLQGRDVFERAKQSLRGTLSKVEIRAERTAYIHHTSGTSSGTPKPITISHQAAVGGLPSIPRDHKGEPVGATFTTTPLYHGGPADIFRAWTSSAMIWLFPTDKLPITAANIVRCLDCASHHVVKFKERCEAEESIGQWCPQIAYFTSVPYVLQMMSEDRASGQWLQKMQLVGVGGAALPQDVGDRLVQKDINLVSRFGSAECGFLLSSHRDYLEDDAWSYLRHSKEGLLKFEQRENGLSELVVLQNWPQMSKRNREDGSYATSDLFEPHRSIADAWKYHSRADSQLTLISGLKFDPAYVEEQLTAQIPFITDTLVFGEGRMYPGALLFRSKEALNVSDSEVISKVAPVAQEIAADGLAQAKIPGDMLIPMPWSDEPALQKSSKGTILRRQAEERYARVIDHAYNKIDQRNGTHVGTKCPDGDLPNAVLDIVASILARGHGLQSTTDLFSFGVDSIAAIKIRQSLQQLLPLEATKLPLSIVEDCGTVQDIATYILKARHGEVTCATGISAGEKMNEHAQMMRLVDEHSNLERTTRIDVAPDSVDQEQSLETIVLTGATGALGSHVLEQLRGDPRVGKIYCLVRGADEHAATERVRKALSQRQLQSLENNDSDNCRVYILKTQLHSPSLGLSKDKYNQIACETTAILHLAWSVNFRMRLSRFKNDIEGLKNLLCLALSSPRSRLPLFGFCSSTASSMNYVSSTVPEAVLRDPSSASEMGYSQSKWVAEQICVAANEHARLRGRVSIFRTGQLSGDTRTGIWNAREAWPLMLSTVKLMGSLPNLDHEILDWLPVDMAAKAIVTGFLRSRGSHAASFEQEIRDQQGVQTGPQIFHILNDSTTPTWQELLIWLKRRLEFKTLAAQEWVQELQNAADNGSDHPALQLLGHWKNAYEDHETVSSKDDQNTTAQQRKRYEMDQTKKRIPALHNVRPVDEEYFNKLWLWIDRMM